MNLHYMRPFNAIWLAAALLLTGCAAPFFYSEWIEAPLVADGQTNGDGGNYQAWGKTLQVSDQSTAVLKFSLSTLPGGQMPALRKEGDVVTEATLPYALSADKVVKARLVFLVNQVKRPGYLVVESAFEAQRDCYAQESVAPACGSIHLMNGLARDPGPSAQPLLIEHGGFHSVDVTEFVKQRITASHLVLKVRAAPNQSGGSAADFELDSKDQDRFGSIVQGARLLISMSDAMGAPTNAQPYASSITDSQKSYLATLFNMRRDASAATTASTVFKHPNPLLVQDSQTGDGAFFSFAASQYGPSQLRLLQGQQTAVLGIKHVGVLNVEGAVDPVDGATAQPALQWHSVFRNMAIQPTWDNWDTPANTPPTGEPVAITSLPTGQQGVRVFADTSSALVQQTLDNLPLDADYASSHYNVFAISANTRQVLNISNVASSQPRFITAVTPKPSGVIMNFVDKEAQPAEYLWCIAPYRDNTSCSPGGRGDYAVKARIGKVFETIQIMPYTKQGSFLPAAAEINLWTPPQTAGQATALLNRDMANSGVEVFRQGSFHSQGGYIISAGTANREVGQYTGYITRPGHNAPFPIRYENLPLPAPSLQGPTELSLPASVPGAALTQEASFDFQVDDAVAQLDDDTIYWDFASSVASDTTPGSNIKQGNGSKAVRFGFQTPGPRRLSVTSRGDSSATASIDVLVKAATATTLAGSVMSPVYGQPFALTAEVQSGYGAPQGLLTLSADGMVLGNYPLDAAGQLRHPLGLLEPGSHTFMANYEGSAVEGLGSSSATILVNVLQAQSQTVLTLPGSFTPGVPMQVQVQVSAQAPSLSTPDGEVRVQGAGGSCRVNLQSGAGSCTLTPSQGGAQTFSATYAGNSRIAGSAASQISALKKLASQTRLQLPEGLKLGQSDSFSATVAPSTVGPIQPGGSVVISGAGSSCSAALDDQGSASCTLTPTTAGKPLVFTASYAGDESFESSSAEQRATVAGWSSQLEITATPNPATANSEVVLEVRVRSITSTPTSDAGIRKAAEAAPAMPTGTVSLSNNGSALGSAVALGSDGSAILRTRDLLQPGTYTIVATYSGDDSHEPGSVSMVLEVNAAPEPIPVPTWSAWVLALVSVILLGVAAWVMRRRAVVA